MASRLVIPTTHALARWEERFPDLNMQSEYDASHFLTRKEPFRKIIGHLHENRVKKLTRYGGSNYLLWTQRSGAVFVMDKGAIVITVLKMPE